MDDIEKQPVTRHDVYFLLKCRCKWWRKCDGRSESLADLREFKACQNCHGQRKFKCPKCGQVCKLQRVNTYDRVQEDRPDQSGRQEAPAS